MPTTRVTPNPAPMATEKAAECLDFFTFVVCQHGAEPTIKSHLMATSEALSDGLPLKLAFSRPGLLTFKSPAVAAPEELDHSKQVFLDSRSPAEWLIRLKGIALGQLRGEDAADLARQAIELAAPAATKPWDAVHVFARDPGLPSSRGFEPGATALTDAILEQFRRLLPDADTSGAPCTPGAHVLDVILIEPTQWLIGCHVANQTHEQWPGGVYPVTNATDMISRAYLKMAEGLAWSELPIKPGDRIVEIGSAPGGASQRLLDLGLQVTGIDPAEMDPVLLQHPRFEHWRGKSSAMKRKLYRKFQWLAADANVAPNYTLSAVEDIVNYPTSRIRGMIITLKLTNYEVAEQMKDFVERVRGWGFESVKVRQLATNRRECCLVARRGPGWKPPVDPEAKKKRRSGSRGGKRIRQQRAAQADTSLAADPAPSE